MLRLRFTKIDKLVSKAFFAPLLLNFAIVLFVLLVVFMSHYFEDLAGKDLGADVYLKLFFYFGLVLTPQALPLAVLLSTLMSFGNLGEHFEITAVKSAGIPLTRLLMPMGFYALLITGGAFMFNNYVVPFGNLKAFRLIYDVKQTKPTLEFKEGGFYNDLPDYKIRIERKGRGKNDSTVYGVMIYDHSQQRGNTDLILADSGKMYTMLDNNYLVMELKSGHRFSEYGSPSSGKNEYVRDAFSDAKFVFSLATLGMKETPEDLFRTHKYMKNVSELGFIADSLEQESAKHGQGLVEVTKPYFDYQFSVERPKNPESKTDSASDNFFEYRANLQSGDYEMLFERALNKARNLQSMAGSNRERIAYFAKEGRSFRVEQQHRFTMSVACFIMFLIGAPLGSIIKKGGLGVPVLVSIIFFLIFYFITITGEKYAREGLTNLVLGSWAADMVLLLFGLLFLLQARNDSRLFDTDAYIVAIGRWKARFSKKKA